MISIFDRMRAFLMPLLFAAMIAAVCTGMLARSAEADEGNSEVAASDTVEAIGLIVTFDADVEPTSSLVITLDGNEVLALPVFEGMTLTMQLVSEPEGQAYADAGLTSGQYDEWLRLQQASGVLRGEPQMAGPSSGRWAENCYWSSLRSHEGSGRVELGDRISFDPR